MKGRVFFFLLPGGVAPGFAMALVDAGVKSGVLLLLAAVAAVALRKSAAATRHMVWAVAMTCALTMPILSLGLPQWRVLPSWMGPELAAPEVGSLTAVLPPLPTGSQVQMQQTRRGESETLTIRSDSPAAASDAESPVVASISSQPIRHDLSGSMAMLLGWAIGAGLLLLQLLRSAWSLRRLSRQSEIVRDGMLPNTLKEVAHELRLGRSVTIHVGFADAMPMVWGVWHAHLLLPSSAEQWPAARLRAVMLHELAHVRRRDPLTLMLAQLARAVHWFNPLAWIAVHRLRVEQEQACDDDVLRAGVKPSDYASDVLEIATALRVTPAAACTALSMASPARLENRLRAIVAAASNRTALTGWTVAWAVIAAIVIALPLAMVGAADEKSAASPPGVAVARAEAPAFGEVTEVLLKKIEDVEEEFLDLDTGRRVTRSAFLAGALRDWARTEKMDLILHDMGEHQSGNGKASIRTFDILVAAAPSSRWETATAPEILAYRLTKRSLSGPSGEAHPALHGNDFTYLQPKLDNTDTYFFQTRENSRGILQIIGSAKDSGGVKIRYKLVQQPQTAAYGRIGGSPSEVVTSESKPSQTGLFKTRGGGAEVLQIAPQTEKRGSINTRYKLVREPRAFEPVRWLLLPGATESKQFLNLTDGRSYRAKPTGAPVVYLEHDPQKGWYLIVEGIYNYPTEPEKGATLWESMSAEEISQPAGLAAVPFERKGFYPLRSQDPPAVILIPQWGLLRIAGVDERTTTAMIQYKRVAAEGQRD